MSDLSPDLNQYVERKVASGQFASAEEFAIEAMQLYRELDDRHEAIKVDVRAALEQSDRGQSVPLDMDAIKRELINELDERGRDR